MKMKRWIAVLCLGLALAALLSGCGFGGTDIKPLPEGMDEQTLIAAGEEVFAMLREDKFDEVAAMFREDIRTSNNVTGVVLRGMMTESMDPAVIGTFVKIKQTAVSGETETEEHGFVAFECKYTKKDAAVAVAFDPEMNLIGLSFASDPKRSRS